MSEIAAKDAKPGVWHLNSRGTRVFSCGPIGDDGDIKLENEHGRTYVVPGFTPLTIIEEGAPELVKICDAAGLPDHGVYTRAQTKDDQREWGEAWAHLGDAKTADERIAVVRSISDPEVLGDLATIKDALQAKVQRDLERQQVAVQAMSGAVLGARGGGQRGAKCLRDFLTLASRKDYQARPGVIGLALDEFGVRKPEDLCGILGLLVRARGQDPVEECNWEPWLKHAFWFEARRTTVRIPHLVKILARLGVLDGDTEGCDDRIDALRILEDCGDDRPNPYLYGLSRADNVSPTWIGVELQLFQLGREEGERWDRLGMERPAPPVVEPKPPTSSSYPVPLGYMPAPGGDDCDDDGIDNDCDDATTAPDAPESSAANSDDADSDADTDADTDCDDDNDSPQERSDAFADTDGDGDGLEPAATATTTTTATELPPWDISGRPLWQQLADATEARALEIAPQLTEPEHIAQASLSELGRLGGLRPAVIEALDKAMEAATRTATAEVVELHKEDDREPDRDAFECYDVDERCAECGKYECGTGEGVYLDTSKHMRLWVVCRDCYRCGECGCEEDCEGNRPALEGIEERTRRHKEAMREIPHICSGDGICNRCGAAMFDPEPEPDDSPEEQPERLLAALAVARGLAALAEALPAFADLGLDVDIRLSTRRSS